LAQGLIFLSLLGGKEVWTSAIQNHYATIIPASGIAGGKDNTL
jgi:hypothetical protein